MFIVEKLCIPKIEIIYVERIKCFISDFMLIYSCFKSFCVKLFKGAWYASVHIHKLLCGIFHQEMCLAKNETRCIQN